MLQSKAGYIDARPLTANSAKSTCDARPDHTLGHSRTNRPIPRPSPCPLYSNSERLLQQDERPLSAQNDRRIAANSTYQPPDATVSPKYAQLLRRLNRQDLSIDPSTCFSQLRLK